MEGAFLFNAHCVYITTFLGVSSPPPPTSEPFSGHARGPAALCTYARSVHEPQGGSGRGMSHDTRWPVGKPMCTEIAQECKFNFNTCKLLTVPHQYVV